MQTRILVCVSLLMATSCCVHMAQAQLVNSDFTKRAPDSYNWPANWSAEKTDKGSLYRLVDDDGHSGKDCLRYQCAQARSAGAVTQIVACKTDADYTLSAWLKSDGNLHPAVIVTTQGDPGRELARVVGDTNKEWRQKTVTFNSGTVQKLVVLIYGDVTIRSSGQSATGFSAIDDVQVAEKGQTTAQGGATEWKAPGPNVALHRPYSFSRGPNYGLCADADDKIQLTDGVYSVDYFWTQKPTVGWTAAETYPVVITIDLGQVEPICGVSYNTAAGVAQVHWPRSIYIMTSDDGVKWFLADDLVKLDRTTPEPPAPDVYGTHRYATDQLKTRGRYVGLLIDSDYFVFCDEIEVYRSANPPPDRPTGKPVGSPLDYYWRGMRLESDLDTIAARLKKSRLPDKERKQAASDLESFRLRTSEPFPALPKDTPAILPLNDLQARIYALNGRILKGLGLPPLSAWKKNRYDPLGPIELPEPLPKSTPALTINTMNNEWRGDAVILTNATDQPLRARMRVIGLPGGDNPAFLSLRDVPFVDSAPKVDVASALPEAQRDGQDYIVTIPAGMNRQIWVMTHPMQVKPGPYKGLLQVLVAGASSQTLKIPLNLRVSPVRFPERPRLHLGGWDYTNEPECYDVHATNRDLLIEYLKSRYVDAPWGTGSVLPKPSPGDFDANGQILKPLDFTAFDDWVKRWEGARVFLSFLNAQNNFAGVKMGTPQFEGLVASWTTALAVHMKSLGLRPDQLGLLIWDEPNNEEHAAVILGWANAIHKANAGILVWEDPQYWEPQTEAIQKSLAACDVICPFVPLYIKLDDTKRDAYRKLTGDKRKLWFYDASGPTRALDPYSYYRLQHWLCFRDGAEGSCFWAFGDAGGGSSWNERASDRGSGYAPQYLTKDSVTDSKQMMGIVEGIQDYEYLCLLRDRVSDLEAKGVRSPALKTAKELLESAPREALAGIEESKDAEFAWKNPKDRSIADRMCERLLNALEPLHWLVPAETSPR